MLKSYITCRELVLRGGRSVRNAVADEDGVVSFEYVIVAACIIAVVALVFSKTGALNTALSQGLSAISSKLISAVG